MAPLFNPWWLQSILPGFGHGLSLLNGQSHQDIQRDDRIPVIDDPSPPTFHDAQENEARIKLVKAIVFPVVMYGCGSWTVKKAEH